MVLLTMVCYVSGCMHGHFNQYTDYVIVAIVAIVVLYSHHSPAMLCVSDN